MFERVREYLNNDFETYIRQWFPNAKRFGNNIYKTGDFNDTESKDGSLVFNLTEKYAKDFNTGETAGDIISIYAKRYCNGDNGKALKELINTYNLNYLFPNTSQSNNNNKLSQKSSSLYNDNNKIEKLPNSKNNTNNHKKLSKAEIDKDNKINNILEKIERYKKDDSVDKYLKSRNITKYSPDTYIVKTDKVDILVNISYKTEYIKETNTYKLTNKISGIQEIFLTKDGRKREDKLIPNKIQRTYTNQTMSGNPIRLSPKGENNGYIYITEGIENGLSLQEYINNEVWCALTITNLPTLPFEDNKIYVFVLDNDYKKDNITQANTELINKLNELNIKYRLVDKITNKEIISNNVNNNNTNNINNIKEEKITEEPKGIDNIYNNYNIIYSNGEYNFKTTISKLKELNNKHLFYLIPNKDNQKGCDANDLLRRKINNNTNNNKDKQYKTELEELLDQPLISIENKRIVKQNKRLKTKTLWRPLKPME